jgi:hypothetical protein
MKKPFLWAFLPLLLTGCSSSSWDAVYSTWKASGAGEKDAKLTNDYVRQLPYASLLVAIEPRAEALLVLESIEANKLTWRSSNNGQITTEGGRVVSFSVDDSQYRLINTAQQPDPVRAQNWQYAAPYRLYFDFPHLQLFQQGFDCQLSTGEVKPFNTPLRQGSAQVYIERCHLIHGNYQNQNEYWVDNQGKLVKAKQAFHPKLPGAIVFSEAKPLGWTGE